MPPPRPDLFRLSERLMSMDDATWARHANPLSAWTRFAATPLIFLAMWSPFEIGWWGVLLIGLAGLWTWINPRLFGPPRSTRNWASQVVLGERAFQARRTVPIPDHHRRLAGLTTALSAGFLAMAVAGFLRADFWLAFTAWHAAILAKLWFCDRMVWLWSDMRAATPTYRAWDAADWSAGPDLPAR